MTLFHDQPGLLARFRAGERDALEAVYWSYVDRVEAIVRQGHAIAGRITRVEGASGGEVADLVQEVFARAFRERARLGYDGLRPYGPYLATIARNLLSDWSRQRGRELLMDELDAAVDRAAAEGEGTAGAPDADDEPWASEAVMQAVEQFLAKLAPELREVHEQRYVMGRSQQAAAEALGISRQALRTRENHLRDGLRRALSSLANIS
jgi:RNA polymerase sigma factor (sigma-70 family)